MHGIPFSADYLYKSTERSSEEGKLKYPNMVQCGMVGVVWYVWYKPLSLLCSQVAKLRVPYMVRLSCPIPPLRAPKSRFNSFRLPFNTCREHFHGEVLSKPISVYFLNQSQAGLMSIEQIGVISITKLYQNFDPSSRNFLWPIILI